jgi:hypothetical protein
VPGFGGAGSAGLVNPGREVLPSSSTCLAPNPNHICLDRRNPLGKARGVGQINPSGLPSLPGDGFGPDASVNPPRNQ